VSDVVAQRLLLATLQKEKKEVKEKGEQSFLPLSCDVIYICEIFSFSLVVAIEQELR
jgi:hypothetical protein